MALSDRAPYPGLRSFTREEISLFFGRDDCVEAMISRLATSHFLAVIGASGTGKSSLVQAGLLSGLEMGLATKSRRTVARSEFSPRRFAAP